MVQTQSQTQSQTQTNSRFTIGLCMSMCLGCCFLFFPFVVGAGSGVSIAGTLYENDGVTPLGAGKTIVAAVGTSTPSLHSTTTDASGNFAITGIATSSVGAFATSSSAAGDDDSWNDVAYGDGLFVAVGSTASNDTFMTSTDGETWVGRGFLGDVHDVWRTIIYAQNKFVALGDCRAVAGTSVCVAHSEDGLTWTTYASTSVPVANWQDVKYVPEQKHFVAVGSSPETDDVMTSPDGVIWTGHGTTTSLGFSSVAYGNDTYVAIQSGTHAAYTSVDADTWSYAASSGGYSTGMVYTGDRFVSVSYGGTDRVRHSPDGITWTGVSADTGGWNDLLYANGVLLAVASAGSDYSMYSVDNGDTWIVDSTTPVSYWGGLAYGQGKIVAVAITTGDRAMYADAGFGEGTPITLFVDENATTSSSTATTLTYGLNANAGTTTINADLHADTVVLKKTTIASSSNEVWLSNVDFYDHYDEQLADADSNDILFTATTSTTTINADLYIHASTSVFAPKQLVIDGDFINEGSFYAESGTVIAAATAYDVADARYLNETMLANDNGGATVGMWFNNAGTKMIVNSTADKAWSYDLSVPFDLSTASYASEVFTSTEDITIPADMAMSDDGSKLYIIEAISNREVKTFTLSSNFDVSTATSSAESLDHSGEVGNAQGLTLSADGSKLYIVSYGADVYAYDLSTPYDVSTGVYNGETYDLASEVGNGNGIALSADGTKMFIAASSGSAVYAYTLATPWDVSTASYANASFSKTVGGASLEGLGVNSDGSKIYTVYSNQQVHAHTLDSEQLFGTSTYAFTGDDSFYALTNQSETGLTFGVDASSTATTTITAIATTTVFNAGGTYSFEHIVWQGSSSTELLPLRSSEEGTVWKLDVGATANVTFADVQDSNASLSDGGITSTTSANSGNNTNWFGLIRGQWNDTDWTEYSEIRIDPTHITNTLYDFPVYVNLTDLGTSFWDVVSDGGGDIRVTTGGPGPIYEIPREVVSASTTAKTGELHFKAPQIQKDIETTFRIYYNGVSAQDYLTDMLYGAENVWSNDFMAVYHLGQDPSEGVGAILDSTRNTFAGTASGTMTTADLVVSKIGTGLDFDGVDDFVDLGTVFDFSNFEDLQISSWVDYDSSGSNEHTIFSNWDDVSSADVLFRIEPSDDSLEVEVRSTSVTNPNLTDLAVVPNEANHVVYRFSNTGGYFDGFVNGVESSSDGSVSNPMKSTSSAVSSYIGSTPHVSTDLFTGVIDELRVASTSRSAAWISAEYINQSTSTDFYSTSTSVGALVLADHTAGQAPNAFSSADKTDTEFFVFHLATSTQGASVTNLVLSLSGARRVTESDLTNLELYLDVNNDGLYSNGTDTQVSTGVVELSGANGSIVFATDFTVANQGNYIVVGDTVSIRKGAQIVFDIQSMHIDAAQVVTGDVTSVQHFRKSGGGGRSYYSGGESKEVGETAPAGDGDVGGGTNEGGELIGSDPDYKTPTADTGSWTNGTNAYDDTDGTYATDAGGNTHDYSNHGFVVPNKNQINGIAVQMEISGTTAAGDIDVALSWDGGASWTSAKKTPTLTGTDAVVTLGGSSDTWGHTWATTEFSNANFAVRITGNPSSNTVQVDAVQVRVYHQAGGGGGGGGGAI